MRVDATAPSALTPSEISNAEIIAWPFDPVGNIVRNGSRLNKVLLVRLDPATLVGDTRERALTASSPTRRSVRMVGARSRTGSKIRRSSNARVTTQNNPREGAASSKGHHAGARCAAAENRGRQAGRCEAVHRPSGHCTSLTGVALAFGF